MIEVEKAMENLNTKMNELSGPGVSLSGKVSDPEPQTVVSMWSVSRRYFNGCLWMS